MSKQDNSKVTSNMNKLTKGIKASDVKKNIANSEVAPAEVPSVATRSDEALQPAGSEDKAYKTNFNFKKNDTEIKSAKKLVTLKPSVLAKGERIAKANKISFNEFIARLIEGIEEE
ncbi:MAG: hypothetical protein HUJ56_00235 [Erysipelotrichaceae bacterium]|nr:hypothetical protein [Erysipelotrichaceae bacterium]